MFARYFMLERNTVTAASPTARSFNQILVVKKSFNIFLNFFMICSPL